MNMCIVNTNGELLEILQSDREAQEGEFKLPLDGYYEVFNIQRYSQAVWDFTENKWKGVGEPILVPEPEPSEVDVLKKDLISVQEALDFIVMNGGL